MADDTFTVTETTQFHPADTPRGTLYYNLEELTDSQQTELNSLKIDTIRENNKYLAANPEIKAIIALLLRTLLRHRPEIKIHEFIAKFFNRSTSVIHDEVFEYLDQKKVLKSKQLSEVKVATSRKSVERKRITIERSSDFICHEECTCDHAVSWKIPHYIPFDDMSFEETEHWLTPKSSRTTVIVEESSEGVTSDRSFSEIAHLYDLAELYQDEDTYALVSVEDDGVYGEHQSEEHILSEIADRASPSDAQQSPKDDQNLAEADERVNIELGEKEVITEQTLQVLQESKLSPSAEELKIVVNQGPHEQSLRVEGETEAIKEETVPSIEKKPSVTTPTVDGQVEVIEEGTVPPVEKKPSLTTQTVDGQAEVIEEGTAPPIEKKPSLTTQTVDGQAEVIEGGTVPPIEKKPSPTTQIVDGTTVIEEGTIPPVEKKPSLPTQIVDGETGVIEEGTVPPVEKKPSLPTQIVDGETGVIEEGIVPPIEKKPSLTTPTVEGETVTDIIKEDTLASTEKQPSLTTQGEQATIETETVETQI